MADPLNDTQARRLVQIYDEAEKEILRDINRLLLSAPDSYSVAWQKTILARITQIRADLLEGARTWTQTAVNDSYRQGMQWADKDPLSIGPVIPGFGSIHQQAVSVLAENTYNRFVAVDQIIGRRVDDIYREMALESVKGSVVGYETTDQAARKFRRELADRGITGFVDRAGHEWDMKRYASVVANETTNQAFRQGTINRFLELGHDLVRLSQHSTLCQKCARYQGQTFSLSGTDPNYPPLSEAIAGGLFHVGCKHVLSLAPEERERFLEGLQGKQGRKALPAGEDFTTTSEKLGRLEDASKKLLYDIGPEQRESLKDYTGIDYIAINDYLFGDSKVKEYYKKNHPEIVKKVGDIDRIMEKALLLDDLTVHRGIPPAAWSMMQKVPGLFEEGTIFEYPGFMSTSSDFDSARAFGEWIGNKKMMVEIRVPRGSKAFSVKSVSEVPDESEILINRGVKIKIIGVKDDAENKARIWIWEILP